MDQSPFNGTSGNLYSYNGQSLDSVDSAYKELNKVSFVTAKHNNSAIKVQDDADPQIGKYTQ